MLDNDDYECFDTDDDEAEVHTTHLSVLCLSADDDYEYIEYLLTIVVIELIADEDDDDDFAVFDYEQLVYQNELAEL